MGVGGRLKQKHRNTATILLAFVVLRTFFALTWDFSDVSAKSDCFPFAYHVIDKLGVNSVGQAACHLDHHSASVGHRSDSFIILDMGIENEIVDLPGIDVVFHSELNSNGSLAPLEISLAPSNTNGRPTEAEFVVVFVWQGGPRIPVIEIDIADSVETSRDILYQFIRIRPWPSQLEVSDENLVYVDAVENAHAVYVSEPTPTEIPTAVDILTLLPATSPVVALTETPIRIPTETYSLTVSTIQTETLGQIPTNTSTMPNIEPTKTSTPVITLTVTNNSPVIPTSTDTLTTLDVTTTYTPITATKSSNPQTGTASPTPRPTNTPNAFYTATILSNTSISSIPTQASTEALTSTFTFTPVVSHITASTFTNTVEPPTVTNPIQLFTIIITGSQESWGNFKEWFNEFIRSMSRPGTAAEVLLGAVVGFSVPAIYSALKSVRKRFKGIVRPISFQTININTANKKMLTSLPGIGDDLAVAIINYRTQTGYFISVDDLLMVPGIGPTTLAKIRRRITI